MSTRTRAPRGRGNWMSPAGSPAHGTIVGEYFEIGCSRQVPWHLRPRAAVMLRYIAANADRIDAVVVGEYERPARARDRCRQAGRIRVRLLRKAGGVFLGFREAWKGAAR